MSGPSYARRGRRKGIKVRPELVRKARQEAGLSLAQVAAGEVTRAAIHLVEAGKMQPSLRTLELIARRTGRPVSYFLATDPVEEEVRARREELERLVATEDFPAAIDLGERLLERDLPPALEAEVHLLVGSAYVRRHEGRPALPHVRAARQRFEEIGDPLLLTEALDQEATALFLLDDPRALPRAVEALERCERLRPPVPALQVRILLHLGSIHYQQGDWRRAARCYEEGLELSAAAPNPRHIAMMHDGLSVAYQQMGDFPAALAQARRAFALYAMDRDERSLVRIEANLGYLLLRQGELEAAEAHLRRSLELCEQRGLDHWGRAIVLCPLAEVHIARGELDQAEALLKEAHAIAAAGGERQVEAMARRLQGRVHLRRGALEAADRSFQQAIAILGELERPEWQRECLMEYAQALQERGELERSIVYWRAAAEIGQQRGARSSEAVISLHGA
ncbi:MAG TPA: tetratricopeptide repeat protein [Candidatus Dormibacteraeota bacterium]|nr:tetratricopeptide repeat protein [Candidatus Dormibacteraeota bacterium]